MTRRTPWQDPETWQQHGLERGYDKRNPMSLHSSDKDEERSWYDKGSWEKWLKDFSFERKKIKSGLKFNDFKSWKRYGTKRGFDHRNSSSLFQSEDGNERLWYSFGQRRDWLKEFNFSIKQLGRGWSTSETWQQYGLEQRYNERNPASLSVSEDKKERSWYSKGYRKGWLKKFDFSRMVERWLTSKDWKQYGIEKGYDQRNPASLSEGKNPDEKYWYHKGVKEEWLEEFSFKRIIPLQRWLNFETWRQYGIEQRYNEKNITSLDESENEEERSWHGRGYRKGWLKKFNFAKSGKWQDFETWQQYGLEQRYNEKNPTSIYKSDDNEERSWYGFGQRGGWLKQFPFARLGSLKSQRISLETTLEEIPEAKKIGNLVSVTGDVIGLAKILIQMWPERFPSASDLARSLPKRFKGIGESLRPFTLEKAVSFYDTDFSIPPEVSRLLDDILFDIIVDQYQPQFNRDPEGTLGEIKQFAAQKNGVSSLASRVLGYYREVYSFEIPGFGKLEQAV